MKNKRIVRLVLPLLVAVMFILPVQLKICQAAETAEKIVLKESKKDSAPSTEKDLAPSTEDSESFLSSPLMIGIGAAVLVGGAVALGSSGGGDSDSTETAASQTPPTADQLVDPWHAEGNQPGSGRSYSGTFHLFQGGILGYDIYVSDGEHLVGGGSWRLDGYTLSIHTDHGSLYKGDFAPGNINVISLSSSTGWNLTLTR